jgi:hypothetical protein
MISPQRTVTKVLDFVVKTGLANLQAIAVEQVVQLILYFLFNLFLFF